MRWRKRPSLPTTRDTRAASFARRSLMLSTSLKASAIFPFTPVQPSGRRVIKSPLRKASRAVRRSSSHVSPLTLAGVGFAGRAADLRVRAGIAAVLVTLRAFCVLAMVEKGRFQDLSHVILYQVVS